MIRREGIPEPRSWTHGAAWKGAGASLLLHLFVGAAVVVALSAPPMPGPRVVDLTLLPPAGIHGRPVRPVFAATEPPGTAVRPEPPALPAPPSVADPPEVPAPANPPGPPHPFAAASSAAPSPPPAAILAPSSAPALAPSSAQAMAAPATTPGRGPVEAAAEQWPGESGAEPLSGDFARIRDEIQRTIAYPATARRMGWEGKVVVAFRLLPDGSVKDVRIVQGSGYATLDRGAVDAVRNASPFPRSPVDAEIITPVVYRLTTR